jgi:hypothetical protein
VRSEKNILQQIRASHQKLSDTNFDHPSAERIWSNHLKFDDASFLVKRKQTGRATDRVGHLAIDRLEEEMNQLARHYGQMIGVQYGEPFLQKELMKVEDVVKMEVRSI